MTSLPAQLKDIWTRMPMGGRIATAAAAIVTVGMLAGIIYYGSQPDYGVLFSDLKPADAQSIVEKLKAANVPYTLTAGGTTVQVPYDRISELRLQMASEGAISGGHVGFDLFDKTTFGATDFAQQVNYRRAIEGELGRTLEGMDEIESARVHITPKKESVFTEKEEGAKAAVTLRVRQGKELAEERTDAIVSLIASSVEGLDPSNVSVLDTRGRLLTRGGGRSRGGSLSEAGAFHEQLEARQKFEAESSSRILALLEPVVGPGRVRADVAADVSFSQVEQTEEKYNPQSQVIRSQQTSQESRNAPANSQGGVVGARANDPTAQTPPAVQATQNVGDQRGSTTTNYEIDKTVRRTVGGGGQINRLTVSVVVDSKTVEGVEVARTPDELQKIQDIVAAAVGINAQRGDTVVVQTMPFDKPAADQAQTGAGFLEKNRPLISSALKYGVLAAIALLLFMFVIRPAKRAIRLAAASANEPALLPAASGEEAERRGDQAGAARQLSESTAAGVPMTVAEMEARMRGSAIRDPQQAFAVKQVLTDQAIANPETVATTLRGWLQEG